MLRAFRAFDGFRGGDIKAWLLAIVRNCWLSAAAARRRRPDDRLEDHELPAPEAGPEESCQISGGK